MALTGLAKTMAVDVGRYNIHVNVISPAGVMGERINALRGRMTRALDVTEDELNKRMTASYSLERLARKSEIASVAVYLISDEFSAITGQVISVNCGRQVI